MVLFVFVDLLSSCVVRECKMIFVVSPLKLKPRQLLFTAVSSACLQLYREALPMKEQHKILKTWLRQGQMKVVVKANSVDELTALKEKAEELGLASTIYSEKSGESSSVEPCILCILGPVNLMDQVTGHLKLL